MKTLSSIALFLLLGWRASAQSYALDWFTLDGGGGTSTGGSYSLSGTSGQADAGTLSGGSLTLEGGFWSGLAPAGVPVLAIALATPGFATLSWAPAPPGFILQETLSLFPADWQNSPSGAANPVTIPTELSGKFYRLIKLEGDTTVAPPSGPSTTGHRGVGVE